MALLPRDNVLPNAVWGAITTMLVLFELARKMINSSNKFKINIFDKIGFVFIIIITMSILLSGDTNFNKWYGMLRIILPIMVAAYLFRSIEIDKKMLNNLYKLLFIYLICLFGFIIFRLSLISFNIFNVMANRETVWYEKPYGIAITYTTLLILFIYCYF